MEKLNDRSVVADSDLRADMERWHKNKHKDTKEIFTEMCDRNVQYYEKVSNFEYEYLHAYYTLLDYCLIVPFNNL
jgi:hypothetical protein